MWLEAVTRDWIQGPTVDFVLEKAQRRAGDQFVGFGRDVSSAGMRSEAESLIATLLARQGAVADAGQTARSIVDEIGLFATR